MLRRSLLHALLILLALLVLWLSAGSTHAQRRTPDMYVIAAHYGKTKMNAVARVRGLPIVDCMFASDFQAIGEWADLCNVEMCLTCRNTDVSAEEDYDRHVAAKQIELDFYSAQHLCHIKRVGEKRPQDCPLALYKRGKPDAKRRTAYKRTVAAIRYI